MYVVDTRVQVLMGGIYPDSKCRCFDSARLCGEYVVAWREMLLSVSPVDCCQWVVLVLAYPGVHPSDVASTDTCLNL